MQWGNKCKAAAHEGEDKGRTAFPAYASSESIQNPAQPPVMEEAATATSVELRRAAHESASRHLVAALAKAGGQQGEIGNVHCAIQVRVGAVIVAR